jgi:hypothetical protein
LSSNKGLEALGLWFLADFFFFLVKVIIKFISGTRGEKRETEAFLFPMQEIGAMIPLAYTLLVL